MEVKVAEVCGTINHGSGVHGNGGGWQGSNLDGGSTEGITTVL